MDNTNYTTEHRKGQHLLSEERHEIEVRLKDGWSIYRAEKRDQVFKTITGDNGSEFAEFSLLENDRLKVYFTHPYSSCEKGTNECHNRMLRRFIPKGKSISDYTADEICFFADCINGLPRKILHYATPGELFDRQFDLIYAA